MSLQTLLEECGYEISNYSGRGMYGRQCLAIDVDNNNVMHVAVEAFSLFLEHGDTAEDDFQLSRDELCDAFRNSRWDQMGRGMVVYFPDVQVDLADDDDEDGPLCDAEGIIYSDQPGDNGELEV